jgi:predicted PurR-regulated permease PerM
MIPNISLSSTTRWGVNVLLLLAGVVALHLAQSVIIPLLIALMLAAILGPAAAWLHQKLKIRWSLACLTVLFGLVLFSTLLMLVFSVAISKLAVGMASTADTQGIRKLYRDLVKQANRVSPIPLDEPIHTEPGGKAAQEKEQPAPGDPPDRAKPAADKEPPPPVEPVDRGKLANEDSVIKYISDVGPSIVKEVARYTSGWLYYGIVIMFILLFVLLEGRMLARRVVAIFGPSPEVQAKATEVLSDMATQVRTYVVNRTMLNFALAIVMGAVYSAFNLNQAWTWAMLLAILNYIPYLGPIVAGLPPFVDAFVNAGPGGAIAVTIIYAVFVTIEAYFAFPYFLGRRMDLNATTVMLACLFWDLVWGTTGLFLVMPIMAGIKAMLYHIPDGRPWADLMSTSDEEPKPVLIRPPEDPSGNGAIDLSSVKEHAADPP